ncbi:MAG: hypothetical protein JRE23_03395 [Deltaproteobacteria bacterium]|nr:hypothetical protein [Deltaproteobacteria bacterium]
MSDDKVMRSFDTGATRDTAEGKLDLEGFLSPAVLHQYAKFMNMNRLQSDGQLRDSDNWQKGIPMDVYMKSGYRHFHDWWTGHRGSFNLMIDRKPIMAALCGLLFNVMGYIHEELKLHPEVDFDGDEPTPEMKLRQDRVKSVFTTFPSLKDFLDEAKDEQCNDTCEKKEPDLTGFCMCDFDDDCVPGCPCWDGCSDMIIEFNQKKGTPVVGSLVKDDDDEESEDDNDDELGLLCSTCMSIDKCWDIWPCSVTDHPQTLKRFT